MSTPPPGRDQWAALGDAELLAQCAVDTYRASGPGGQHRNKTSSAVRLRHGPSGLQAIAEDSRSQHENKALALKRLRRALYLELRLPVVPAALAPEAVAARPELADLRDGAGRIVVSARNARFWPAMAAVLDILEARAARVSEAAESLGLSTGQLIDLLQGEEHVWRAANACRARHGQKPLKPT